MKRILLSGVIIFFLLGCQKQQPEQEETVETENVINVFAQTLIRSDVPEFIKISGTLEAKIDVVLISEVSGKLMKLNKKLGDWVSKNEPIGEIDSEVIKIQLQQTEAAVLSAEAAYQTAMNNLKASQRLFEQNIISQAEYESAVTAEKGAKAQYDGTLAQKLQVEKMLENALITAPAGGFISELPITPGNYISAGSILCRIVDPSVLIIRTGVGKSVVKQLQNGQQVILDTKNGENQVTGKITGFGVAPSLGSVNYPIEIEVRNDYGLFAGEIVEANILLQMHKDVFAVKQEALVTEFDHDYLYFIDDDNILTRREITVTDIIDDLLLIEGVTAGEKIVAVGTENVENGMKVMIRKEIGE